MSVRDVLWRCAMLTVAAMIRETLYTTLKFVSWYLEQGADQIVLCFDDPDDPAIEILQEMDQLRCVRVTPEFLASVGMTPDRRFVRRQNNCIQKIYHETDQGWFLNVDGDELLFLEGRTIKHELANTPADVRGVTFLPAEHLNTGLSSSVSSFRLLMSRPQVREIYGDYAKAMQRRSGMVGHTEGKTATRVGFTEGFMRQHYLHFEDGSQIVDRTMGAADGAFLFHFLDQGYDVWCAKLPWRLRARGFNPRLTQRLQEIMDGKDTETELRHVYDVLHVADDVRLAKLRNLGVLFQHDLKIDALISRYFPHIDVKRDTSVAYHT